MADPIPIYSGGGSTIGSTKSGSTSGGTSSGSGSSGGGGGGGISGAERRMNAKENEAKRKAATKYREQAKTLQQQADALRKALNGGYKEALSQRLANALLGYKQADANLMEGFGKRVGTLKDSADDNEKARADQGNSNLLNRGRERASAISEAMLHGSGESDLFKAQVMSLRNWSANQAEGNRSFFDTLRGVNSSITDLNVDTKTARLNAESQYNNDRDQLWTQYFNQKSEGYTQLGNIAGQQAELYGLAKEQGNKASGADQKKYSNKSGDYFESASRFATEVWKNPGNSAALRNWQGQEDIEGYQNDSKFENAATNVKRAKAPEGAKLRSWS